MSDKFVCAVDVGTGSARAGIFDRGGTLLGRAEHPIRLNQPLPDHAEHSSDDIWSAVCNSVRAALSKAGVAAAAVSGIGFDATCSLVVRDEGGAPLSISTTGDEQWDTMSWFDHRALAEADECTATRHEVLNYIGGVMSPEMETPKLMWLKRNLPADLAARAPFLRSRRLPDLARQRIQSALAMHLDREMDLSGA